MKKFQITKTIKRNCYRKNCFIQRSPNNRYINEKLKLFHFGITNVSYGICNKCGLVMQTISPTNQSLLKYYKQNFYFENFKKPEKAKIESINRQLKIVKQEFDTFPKSVLEVSLMSLYNLLKFKKNGSTTVHGLEPSIVLTKKIKDKYGIKIINSQIEKFRSNISYDLILLAHVLEHLPDPSKGIRQCYLNQKLDQKILIEVPLFERTELYPVSGLNVEHLYYFDENNLLELIEQNGYEPVYVEKTFESTPMPFIAILAKKVKKDENKIYLDSNYKKQFKELKKMKLNVKKIYLKAKIILDKIPKNKPLYLFGAGFSASNFIYHTKVDRKFNLKGIFDNSPIKQNKYLFDIKILKPKLQDLSSESNIIITTFGSSDQIIKKLSKNLIKKLNFYSFDKNFNFKKN